VIAAALARFRSLRRGLRRRDEVESEIAEEFRLHLEMRTDDLVRAGVDPAEAARRARLEFGNPERFREDARTSRGLAPFDEMRFSLLDFKLSFRMLVRYPALTLVAGLAMAFGIWVGAGTFEIARQLVSADLPLSGGERVVGFRLWNRRAGDERGLEVRDLQHWRENLSSVEALGGYRTAQRNLILGGVGDDPVTVAEVSAAGFRLAAVRPLLGRPLVAADERQDASSVVVLGHGVWRSRFGEDAGVIGRQVQLGRTRHEVVGVMPEGFAFPVSHELWVPLREEIASAAPLSGIFGRLAAGSSLERAQSELTTVGPGGLSAPADSAEFVEPLVLPYTHAVFFVPPAFRLQFSMAVASANLVPLLLLLVICGNVALLLFARAAARESELVVRTALGASRRRIVTQLFAESLVLGGISAVVGLAAANLGLRWAFGVIEGLAGEPLPFWFRAQLSPVTVLYAAALTVLAAAIAGVLPALKITRGTAARLKQATAGGGGVKLGWIWSAVVVAQVAITVVFPAAAFFTHRDGASVTSSQVAFASDEYLTARIGIDRDEGAEIDADSAASSEGDAELARELEERLLSDPAILGVTFTSRLPRTYHAWNQIEVAEGSAEPFDERGHRVGRATVDLDYFEVLRTPIVAGRGFHNGDRAEDARAVIVNEPFVRQVLGGRNALGRHVRYLADESDREANEGGPWYEIVGVVGDLGTRSGYGLAGIYHPSPEAGAPPPFLVAHVRGPPEAFAPRIREAGMLTGATLRIDDVVPMDGLLQADVEFYRFWVLLAVAVSCMALFLSLAAVYSVTAFTVSRRTREIGIRLALGASSGQVLRAILARPLAQVAGGVVLGALLVGLGPLVLESSPVLEEWLKKAAAVGAYAVLMLAVCLIACVVPTRRALRVEPTEALRADA
jgi:putative ABC transport system permease protein